MIIKIGGTEIQTEKYLKNLLTKQYCPDKFISKYTQPYVLQNITIVSNNASMSDYTSSENMLKVLQAALLKTKNSEKPFFINTGFHQEGNIEYKIPIFEFVKSIKNLRNENIEFLTVNNATEMAKKYLVYK